MIAIDRVTRDRVDEVVPLFDRYRTSYGQPADIDGARRFLLDRLDHDESVVFLAQREGMAAGLAQLYPTYSSVAMIRAWLLNDLFVEPDHRRRGVARALLRHVAEFARATGRERVELETAFDNVGARRLYEAEGYRLVDGFASYQLSC